MKSFALPTGFKVHRHASYTALERLETLTTASVSKEELLRHHAQAFAIRRMEIACDAEYKARKIRGFLHLYDGQEAVAVGIEHALTRDDDWITTYRCHGVALVRGVPVKRVFAELFGSTEGISRGKGGSIHLYRKEGNFYGGAAIVGAHVPVGAGLAFAQKYKAKDPKNTGVSLVAFGDGAAVQGQVFEAVNMAMLWKLPVILVVENNAYGMGTSTDRSAALPVYYKQGGEIVPGVQVNGGDSLAVREAIKACKEHVATGHGPVYLEALTYRFVCCFSLRGWCERDLWRRELTPPCFF